MDNILLCGDAYQLLQTLSTNSIQCCVTSPPYYGLRNYGNPEEIGQEKTLTDYIAHLVTVFREVRRVLRPDGTLWLNIGDSYAGSGKGQWNGSSYSGKNKKLEGMKLDVTQGRNEGMKPKDLMLVPARLAMALQDDGWYLRSDIIWHKPNVMPESVKDRPTSSYEHLFLFSKNVKYYYDNDAVREKHSTKSNIRNKAAETWTKGAYTLPIGQGEQEWNSPLGRNKRNVWTINTKPYRGAHFAVMPEKLVEPCILAGSKEGDMVLDPFMGAGTVAKVARDHHRFYTGIELNPAYIALIQQRLKNSSCKDNIHESSKIEKEA